MSAFSKLIKTCDSEEQIEEFENTIAKISNINENDIGGKLLYLICKCNYTKFAPRMIELLIQRGVDVNFIEKTKKINSLMRALQYNTCESIIKITELLTDAKINVNSRDENSNTPLIYALTYNHHLKKHCDYTYDVVKKLLDANADPNIKNEGGKNTIYYCTNIKVMELLVKYGAIPNARDINPRLYSIFVSFKNDEIAELKKKIAELEEKNAELLSIMDYIPNGDGYENCAEDYNKNLNLQHYEIANE